MSGEFGDNYSDRFFHNNLQEAVDGGMCAKLKTSKKWVAVLKEINRISTDISYAEASDTGEDDLIVESIKVLPQVKKALNDLEEHLELYDLVAKKKKK